MRGCITKKGSKYSIVIYLGRREDGKRKYKWFNGYQTKREAEKALPGILNQFQQNTYIEPTKVKVKEYLKNWLATYVENNLSPTTVSGYRVNIERHIIPALGNIELQKLQPVHIQELYNEKQLKGRADGKGGLSAKSIVYIHRVLRKALQQAFKLQLVSRNVADFVELPKIKKFHPNILDEKKVLQMIGILKETKCYMPVLLALSTGMRRGEALAVRWSDIDFEKRTLTISQNIIPARSDLIISTPKTERSNRTILVSESVIKELLIYQKRQLALKKELEEIYQDNDLVCCRMDGAPLNPSTFSSDFAEELRKYNLPHIRFHDLRHINATLMLKNNIPAKIASERLGHSSVGITLDLYSHVIGDMQQEAARKIENALFSEGLEID